MENLTAEKESGTPLPMTGFESFGLPEMVKNELNRMSEQRRTEFLRGYSRRKKAIFAGYLLWIFFGWHYAYLRKWGVQFLFWLSCGGFIVWWLIDFFRVPGLVADYNKDMAISVLKDLKIIVSDQR